MHNKVKCPSCQHEFDLDLALTAQLEENIKQQYELQHQKALGAILEKETLFKKQQEEFEEKKKRENEIILERVKKETEARMKLAEEQIRKEAHAQNEVKLTYLEKQQQENEAKIKWLQNKELEVLELNKRLQEQQEREAFNLQKQKLDLELELKEKISKDILAKEREKFDLEKRELEKQLHDQKKLTEQMSRKLEQGSMQMQGEVQEIKLEEILMQAFPYDEVKEVGKGKRGADCMLVVKNEVGMECGSIVFESKRTKEFNKDWLPKLKEDLLDVKGDIPVLVTQVLPSDIKNFDQMEGVWICGLQDVIQLVKALREGIMNVARAKKFGENKGEKKEMLYNYFTSNEFLQQMRAINEAYLFLKSSIDRERMQMERIWKEREKQIDKVLLNNNHLLGSIKGIAGNDVDDRLLESGDF